MAPAPFRHMVDEAQAAAYRAAGWWSDETVVDLVDLHADGQPDADAFVTPTERLTWAAYRDSANRLAATLRSVGLEPGERVAVLLRDGASVHVAFVANEKAGLVTVGIGARAGEQEIRHLVRRTGAVAVITHARHRDADTAGMVAALKAEIPSLRHHVVIPVFEGPVPGAGILVDGRPADAGGADSRSFDATRLGADDLFLINSTSGTTGLPKCVMHTQNSKRYMALQACEVAGLHAGREVVLGLAPVPFGFGLFTTHFLAAILGGPAVVSEHFSADLAVELIERERATVLVCVSTQFKMMLHSPEMDGRDLSSLRVMFTGGEMIPYDAARQFEARTGAAVLNFYGSNESGVATGTRLTDPPERRLRTGGGPLRGTEVRLYDRGVDVTASGRGQPASRGPGICLGYDNDPAANAELFTPDGFVLHADIVTMDGDGYLTVVGRTSEIIIRGGKNISAAVVEDGVAAHGAVALAAAVAMPDELFGERVCVFVELHPGATLSLGELVDFLTAQGASKENLPEQLVVLDELPRSSGGKVAKGVLRRRAEELAAELAGGPPRR